MSARLAIRGRSTPSAANAGYVHAPSAAHAATAAVLRSAHLSHGGATGSAWIFLTAAVRAAIELLEGVREGQPVGALIGYRIERGLAGEAPAAHFAAAGAGAGRRGQADAGSAAAETVAATNVVDGIELLGLAGRAPPNPPTAATLVGRLQPAPPFRRRTDVAAGCARRRR